MDETFGVRGRERAPRLEKHPDDVANGTLLGGEPALERSPAQTLHGQEHPVLVNADVEDGDDVRVRELRDRLGLSNQTLLAPHPIPVPLLRGQELESDLAIEIGIERRVDDAHAAGAQALEDHVAADDAADVQSRRTAFLGADAGLPRIFRRKIARRRH